MSFKKKFCEHKATYLLLIVVAVVAVFVLISPVIATSSNPCSSCHGSQGYSQTLSITGSSMPSSLTVGQSASVTAIVRNTINVNKAGYSSMSSVTATLKSQSGHFAIGSPTISLGNLAAGGSSTVTWQITASSAGSDSLVFSSNSLNTHNSVSFSDTSSSTITIAAPVATPTPISTPIPTPVSTPTILPTPILTPSQTPTPTPASTPAPTQFPTATPTNTSTPTPIPIPTSIATPNPTSNPSPENVNPTKTPQTSQNGSPQPTQEPFNEPKSTSTRTSTSPSKEPDITSDNKTASIPPYQDQETNGAFISLLYFGLIPFTIIVISASIALLKLKRTQPQPTLPTKEVET